MTNQKDQSEEKNFQGLDLEELHTVSGGGLQNTWPVSSAPPSPASPKPLLQRSKSLPAMPDMGRASLSNFSPNEMEERLGHISTPRDPIVVPETITGRMERLIAREA